MRFKILLMKKFGLETKVVISVVLLAFFIFLFERYEVTTNITKQFLETEKSRNTLLINTISPIISLNISLGLLDANKEYLDEIIQQNSDILMLKILNKDGVTIYEHQAVDKENRVKKNDENYFTQDIRDNTMNESVATVELYISDTRYKKLLKHNTKTSIEIFLIVLVVLLFFVFIIKKEFSFLKDLSSNILKYDPKKNNFPLLETKRNDEVGIIHNSIISMVKKIATYTDLLDELNNSLELKVQERTQSLIDTNNQLNEYKENLEEKVKKAIQEREKTNLLLAQQSKMASLGEMLASVSHQWKQPLSVISAINLNLKVKSQLTVVTQAMIDKNTKAIDNQLEFMTHTLKDFSDFFMPDKKMTEFSVKDSITGIVTLFGSEYKDNNINININQKTTANNLSILSYNNEFRQVILNILSNAKDAILQNKASRKEIDILIASTDNGIDISIQDYAGGIEGSVKDNLFEPYITTKADSNGTGIGLYMSKRIIEDSMHGKIKVSNQNGGAIFIITLPYTEEQHGEI